MTRILLTGASGFVGRTTCNYLTARGCEVVAATRQPCGLKNEIVVGNIETANWDMALDGIDAVMHLAARVHQMKDASSDPLAAFRSVNRDATIRLAGKAAEAGINRFVYLSSVKAAIETTGTDAVDEAQKPAPASPYGVSKLEAEQGLFDLMHSSALDPVILRPPLVYGPGVKGNFLSFLRLARTGLPLPLASIDNRRSFIGVTNLASAIEQALCTTGIGGQVYYIEDGVPLSTPELIRRLARAQQKTSRLFASPPKLLRMLAGLLNQRDRIDRLCESLVISSSRFRQATGWQPVHSMEEELARLVSSLYR